MGTGIWAKFHWENGIWVTGPGIWSLGMGITDRRTKNWDWDFENL